MKRVLSHKEHSYISETNYIDWFDASSELLGTGRHLDLVRELMETTQNSLADAELCVKVNEYERLIKESYEHLSDVWQKIISLAEEMDINAERP